jgi:hypothetical protein
MASGFAAFTLSLLALTPGCEGGQTGDLSGDHDNETGSTGCDQHREKLASFDEQTDAGSAEQLLAYAEQSFAAPLDWRVAPDGQSWTVGPESGTGQIHLAVTRGANAYRLTYTPAENTSGLDIGVICPPPELGVEAHVEVTSDGGALAESYDTLLHSSVPGVATLSVPLDLTKLGGSLAVSYTQPRTKLVQTNLSATLLAEGMTGRIAGLEQVDSGTGPNGSSSASPAVLAVWPDSEACHAIYPDGVGLGLPVEEMALGATGSASLASVATMEPVAIHWLDGIATTLSVAIEPTGDGCLRVRDDLPAELGGGVGITYPVTIAVKSEDGWVDASYAGQVAVTGSGAARRVTASASLQLAVADVGQSGFAMVEVPSGADSVQLQFQSSWVNDSLSGSLRLTALTDAPCSSEPAPATPGGGSSSPGCAGQTQTPLETASWGD